MSLQIASASKSPLARSASTRSPSQEAKAVFIVQTLIESNQLGALVTEVRRRHVTRDSLAHALSKLGAVRLTAVLATPLGKPLNTSVLFEIYRSGGEELVYWTMTSLPKTLELIEHSSRQNVLHMLAQRSLVSDVTFNEMSLRGLFSLTVITAEHMSALDNAGQSPLHYISLFGYEQVYTIVEMRFPQLCNLHDARGATPASIAMSRIKRDIVVVRRENVRLRQNEEAVRGNEDLYKAMHEAVEEREALVKKQEAQLHALTDDRERLLAEQQRIERERREQSAELEQLRLRCKESHSEANGARESFGEAFAELERYRIEAEEMRNERDKWKRAHDDNTISLGAASSEQERLSKVIADLKRQRDYAETQLDTQDSTTELATRRNQQLIDELAHLETEIDELAAQRAYAANECVKLQHENARIVEQRNDIDTRLDEQRGELAAAQQRVDDVQKRSAMLEKQLDQRTEAFRLMERDLEDLQNRAKANAAHQKTTESDYRRQLSALTTDREALTAQLVDARNARRHAEETAQREIERVRGEVDEMKGEADKLRHHNEQLNSELVTAKTRAQEELARQHAEAQRELRQARETTARLTPDAQQKLEVRERELVERLQGLEKTMVSQLMEQQAAARQSTDTHTALQEKIRASEDRIAELEKSSNDNFASAAEWETYCKEVQTRHEQSIQQMQSKLGETEDMLRRARKELEQERLIASTGPSLSSSGEMSLVANRTLGRAVSIQQLRSPRISRPEAKTSKSDTPASTLRRQSEKPAVVIEDEAVLIMCRNAELNAKFFRDAFMLVRTGDHTKLTDLFNFGLNPNTRGTEGIDLDHTMLEVLVRAASDTNKTLKQFGDEGEKLIEKLTKTLPLIVQRGGDWDGADEFIASHGNSLPEKFLKILKKRDDASPFCKALLTGRAEEAEKHMATVENFNRVPTDHEAEGLTYLHVAVLRESARLVQAMLITGRCDVHARDKNDRTPLHLLLQKCDGAELRLRIAQYFLAAGARPNAPCIYEKIHERTKAALAGTSTSIVGSLFKRSGSTSATVAQSISKMTSDAEKYGTPLAMATALGDTELVECMKSRRYLLPTIDKNAATNNGTPLLQDYIIRAVEMHVSAEDMLASKQMQEGDELHKIYMRYRFVFQCFNPNFGGAAGYETLRDSIFEAAGIDKFNAKAVERSEKLSKMILRDESIIGQRMASSKAHSSGDDSSGQHVNANASETWRFCLMLMQATKAVSESWFDVSNMIESAMRLLYPEAVLLALHYFVENNKFAALEYMLGRRDMLFGGVDVNSTVDEDRQFTCMELAAHYGVAETLEWLMERQRGRIDQPGVHGRTIVSIASAAGQPIAIVAIDNFKFRNRMSLEAHPNAAHYGVLTSEMGNTVLHQCARQQRPDLLRYCISQVAFQIGRTNKHGQTPLKVAEDMANFQQKASKEARERAQECIRIIRDKLDCSGSASSTPRDSMTPPPPLRAPPPIVPRLAIDASHAAPSHAVPVPNATSARDPSQLQQLAMQEAFEYEQAEVHVIVAPDSSSRDGDQLEAREKDTNDHTTEKRRRRKRSKEKEPK